jgi:hypothetical protein
MAEEPAVSQEAHGSYIAQAAGGGDASIQVYASPPSLSTQNRARFLVRLRVLYRELLSQPLHGAVRMTLELAGYPEAITPPVQLLYESDQQSTHSLPAGTSLFQVYTEARHELLLLGDPGAGKSTLLLELASELVAQAEQDHNLLLPVVVPLSPWASNRLPLEQWLANQVALLYDVSQPLSRSWIRQEHLLLARSHYLPWRAPWFLEEGTARILLRRVGGGYSFPHRLLLDYFADLPQETP